jgi:hypothetical protein
VVLLNPDFSAAAAADPRDDDVELTLVGKTPDRYAHLENHFLFIGLIWADDMSQDAWRGDRTSAVASYRTSIGHSEAVPP